MTQQAFLKICRWVGPLLVVWLVGNIPWRVIDSITPRQAPPQRVPSVMRVMPPNPIKGDTERFIGPPVVIHDKLIIDPNEVSQSQVTDLTSP